MFSKGNKVYYQMESGARIPCIVLEAIPYQNNIDCLKLKVTSTQNPVYAYGHVLECTNAVVSTR